MVRGRKLRYGTHVCPKCNIAEVTDHHPSNHSGWARMIAVDSYGWKRINGETVCPLCAHSLVSKDTE